jgi:hypothetical protein
MRSSPDRGDCRVDRYRAALARAFVAKAVIGLPTPSMLIERHPGIRAREGHLQSATHSSVTYGPYVTQNRKEGPHMSTKSTLRADLDAEDRKTLAAAPA